MKYPFAHPHNTHTHHHQRDEEDNRDRRQEYPPPGTNSPFFDQPPPPPQSAFYGRQEPPYPPPPSAQVTHVHHCSHGHFLPPASDDFNYSSFPPPPPQDYQPGYGSAAATTVQHVSHSFHQNPIGESETHHSHNRPHLPSFDHHQTHQRPSSDLANKRTFKIVSKAEANFSLTIRDGKVILARSDPSDEFQHWYKDEKYSTRMKDEEGCPCFSLVNKATGRALKHSLGASHPVQLIPYIQDRLDESILWTESRDLGDGFRAIRMINNIHLNVDAFHSDKQSGGVHDGTIIVLWAWNKGDNQRWKIVPNWCCGPRTKETTNNGRLSPPPPRQSVFYGRQGPPYPPPSAQVNHVHHSSEGYFPPASDYFNYSSFPPPPQDYHSGYGSAAAGTVQNISHSFDQNPIGESEIYHSHNRPHLPSFDHHQTHQRPSSDLANKRTFKIVSKAEANFSLTIRDGKVILARSDPSNEFQHWYKDEKYSTRMKDEEGCPCFSLVNKATGQALKHSLGASHPVQLIPYNQDRLDESILWTESRDLGDGFRAIRMVNNIHLNVDAFHGDKQSGGVHDGTVIVLWAWNNGDNQRWKIVPYCKFLNSFNHRNTFIFFIILKSQA